MRDVRNYFVLCLRNNNGDLVPVNGDWSMAKIAAEKREYYARQQAEIICAHGSSQAAITSAISNRNAAFYGRVK